MTMPAYNAFDNTMIKRTNERRKTRTSASGIEPGIVSTQVNAFTNIPKGICNENMALHVVFRAACNG